MTLINFFSKRVSVYTALDHDTYFKVAQAFQSEGLSYKVKRINQGGSGIGSNYSANDFASSTFYEFFVKKEEQHMARKILLNV